MEPNWLGFVDGNGDMDDLIRREIQGPESLAVTVAVEALRLNVLGDVKLPNKDVLRVRNSSGQPLGCGSFRIHLSTLEYLADYIEDLRASSTA